MPGGRSPPGSGSLGGRWPVQVVAQRVVHLAFERPALILGGALELFVGLERTGHGDDIEGEEEQRQANNDVEPCGPNGFVVGVLREGVALDKVELIILELFLLRATLSLDHVVPLDPEAEADSQIETVVQAAEHVSDCQTVVLFLDCQEQNQDRDEVAQASSQPSQDHL
eukprot:CAMPEP_0170501018 /NCGR_PEP_ID=MMETSP0208-20121228/36907_1 /TAXON_ID=197538 /ORGANISM="Strombidium inclinatum, Strain S3" /LENGTH=168 /DNA_ID=CAMNT_0010779337 /DNA_START=107 /DNA_END=612 /DNA_ORIENTATION=+